MDWGLKVPSQHQAENLLEQTTQPVTSVDELISLGCGSPLPAAKQIAVHEMVAEFAQTKPSDVAIVGAADIITYGKLHAWALQIASRLSLHGIGREKRVAILVEPSAAMVAAVLGILQCGAAYVPLDQNQPDQRIAEILADADVSGILSDNTCVGRLKDFNIPSYTIGVPPAEDYNDSLLSQASSSLNSSPEDPAYLIYTSGSTGEPKGVLIEHGQLSNSTLARRTVYPGSPIFLLVSPLAFDSSIAGLWGTLTAGGKLIVASHNDIRDPERLIQLIEKHKITQLLCIPSLYEALLDAAVRTDVVRINSLNTVIVAGEVLHSSLVQKHFDLHRKSVVLVNEYGPTETTVWATYHRFNAPGPITIGGPIPGIQLYILDDDLQLTPRGEVGELFISGSQVAEGYFNRRDATERAFLADRFAKTADVKMYRTGDLVRWNSNGTLDFMGRRDHQIKIRGHRVELGAIEVALRENAGIRDAVVVANSANTFLTAFVLVDTSCTSDSLRAKLALVLPSIMVPSQIHFLDRFPLTITGKVDRAALSMKAEKMTFGSPINQADQTNISNDDMTACVTAAWNETLNLDSVPVDVNFFDLGGHSLMIFKLQNALEHHTGKRPTVVSLFRHTTVSAQVKLLYNGDADASELSGQDLAATRRARALRSRRQNVEPEVVI